MALLIPADNSQPVRTVTPENGTSFTVGEMAGLIGCRFIEINRLPDGRYLVCDESGMQVDNPAPNRRVAEFLPIPSVREYRAHHIDPPLPDDPDVPAFFITGDVLIVQIDHAGYEHETVY